MKSRTATHDRRHGARLASRNGRPWMTQMMDRGSGVGRNRTANIAADRVGVNPRGLTPALAGWLRGQRVGTVGLAVLPAAAVLAVALAIHGYGNRGLALPAVAASTASPAPS